MWLKFLTDESGATVVEYGLLASLIILGMIGGATQVGSSMEVIYDKVEDDLG